MKRCSSLVFFVFLVLYGKSQTLGGDAAYNFLRTSASTQLTALGGVNVSNISKDVSLSWHNPALLRSGMNKQFSGNFNLFFAGIKNVHAQAAFHSKKMNTTFSGGVNYFNYGSATQTDPSGNILGDFRPYDYSIQISASRKYLERWFYGVTIKFIQSSYGTYNSNAIAADVGLNYTDSTSGFQAGFLAKNMGTQLKTYAGVREDMPFDLQLGFTKRFIHSPFQLSLTTHRLHQFDLAYNDTVFNNDNGLAPANDGVVANLFRHFVFAGQVYVGEKFEFSLAYNILRGTELRVPNSTSGLSGISFGAGFMLQKLQFRYARSQYQNSTGYNQVGINVQL
jgi:hypothetical protein